MSRGGAYSIRPVAVELATLRARLTEPQRTALVHLRSDPSFAVGEPIRSRLLIYGLINAVCEVTPLGLEVLGGAK